MPVSAAAIRIMLNGMPNQTLAMVTDSQRQRRIGQPVNRLANEAQAISTKLTTPYCGGEHPFPQRADDQRRQHPGRQQQAAQEVRAGEALREEQRDRQADPELRDDIGADEDQRIDQRPCGTPDRPSTSR